MVLLTLTISFFNLCFQNQVFFSFSIQEYSTLCSFSAFLGPSFNHFTFLKEVPQILLHLAGFYMGTKHSMFCFGIDILLCNTQHFGDISTQGHCLQVSSNSRVNFLGQNSQFFYWFPLLYPRVKCWNSSKFCPSLSFSLLDSILHSMASIKVFFRFTS